KRHPEIKARTVKPVDWNRHEKYTYEKMTHWFEVIERCSRTSRVMLSMLSCVEVLVGRDELREYRGAGVKRTIVIAIECTNANGR
ncbi:hypothetical protein BKA58DRAFT_291576, partial [Alternaria rosae]|uniref:uncharacterized protein n=1 Tax=Alternaria rosae TaxID=1187941 RepID=UPI001E8CB463